MLKKLILLTITSVGALFGSNPFTPVINESWEVFEGTNSWTAERLCDEEGYRELLGYDLIPIDYVDFESLDEFLEVELALAEHLGYELVVHYSSQSAAHISWTVKGSYQGEDWMEWGTILIRHHQDDYEVASYHYIGADLEGCSTNRWLTLFAQEVENGLLTEKVSAQ